jgi:hypothetical protein
METQAKDLLESPILLPMLTRMGEELERLEKLPKAVEGLDNRISSLEKLSLTEEPVGSVLPTNSGNSSDGELESQAAYLESPEYREETILEWLHNLDQGSYYALGVRKGYLEEINTENQPPLGELKDPSPEVILSQEKPEDLTGWAYSKTLNCYIKLEGGMEV